MKNLLFVGGVLAALAAVGSAREALKAPQPGQAYEDLFAKASRNDPTGFASRVRSATLACNGWDKEEAFRSETSRKTTMEIALRVLPELFDLRAKSSKGGTVERNEIGDWLMSQFGDRLRNLNQEDFDQVTLRVGEAVRQAQCVFEDSVGTYYHV